jgi:diguanylate cyclase (GGDEF)-like protein/PAS domain S-box-containing protein
VSPEPAAPSRSERELSGVSAAAVLAVLPGAVGLLDADGTITWLSERAGELLGRNADEVAGESIFGLLAMGVQRNLEPETFAMLVDGQGLAGPFDVAVARPDGSWVEVEVHAWNALDDPRIGRIVVVGREITGDSDESRVFRQRDAWASSLLRGAAEVIVVTDRGGRIAYASPSVRRILGRDPTALTGQPLVDLVHPDDRLAPALEGVSPDRILGTGGGRDRVVRFGCTDGSWLPMRIQRTMHEDLGDHLLVFNAREVRAERDAASLLSDQTLLLERIARGAPLEESVAAVSEMVARRLCSGDVVVSYLDGDDFVSRASGVDAELLAVLERSGVSRPDATAPEPGPDGIVRSDGWDALLHAASGGRQVRAFALDLVGGQGPVGRLVVLRSDPAELTLAEREVLDVAVDLVTIATERHHLQRRLAHGAHHDELTGLANRRELMARMRVALGRPGVSMGVLYVDVDRFKLINDSLGHDAGDQLLLEVCRRFTAALRPGDLVARVGGDEFVVLCPDLDGPEEAAALASRLTDSLVAPVDLPGGRIVVSASVGVVHAVGPAEPADVLQDADLAMYDAKERGRNRIALFHSGLRDKAVARLEVETALRDALRADEMKLHFQPVVRLADGEVVGVEALLRWDRPGVGIVSPGDFVPVATDTGLIMPLGRWVVDQACGAAARWKDLEVAANLSARQLADADLVDFVAGCLERHQVAPHRLCLEVTEADLVTDPELVVEQLRRFKELGIRLAIDDFGTGFATLDYLRRFSAADVLKVDASFVAGLGDPSKHDLAIVSAALVLADNLGFDTIAEGVETSAQREVLSRLGCELAQGHLFSEPLEADEIDALLERGGRIVPTSVGA